MYSEKKKGRNLSVLSRVTFVEANHYSLTVNETNMCASESAAQLCEGIYAFIAREQLSQIGESENWKISFSSYMGLFPNEVLETQEAASTALFTLLLHMHAYDKAKGYEWATGISNNPKNPLFSFSLGGEAFFIPFMYKDAYAPARRSPIPFLVFNSHRLFQYLKDKGKFSSARNVIQKNQLRQYGFIPDLLHDYGDDLEFPQYFLPNKDDLEAMWDVLYTLGGPNPFGPDNGVK